MRFSLFTALALVAAASAQNSTGNSTDYASGLLALLGASNLTTLSTFAASNAATLLPLLQSGNHTVFAPTDAAFAKLGNETLSNTALVGNVILYHVFSGGFPVANLSSTNHTIARSALNATGLVNLPGGQNQVAALVSSGEQVTVLPSNVTSVASATYQNLQIYILDTVLTVPGNLSSAIGTSGLTALDGVIQQFAPTVTTALESIKGVTLFAPNNAAFNSAASLLASVGTNATLIQNVLLNHVLNGTVVYSSQIENGANVTSASGETLSFTKNSTGTFVTAATFTAEIVRSDVIISNGVVHVIDNILANTASNPDAAASAASSAVNAGSSATATPTGPVTASGSNPSSTSRPAAGNRLEIGGALGLGLAALAILA